MSAQSTVAANGTSEKPAGSDEQMYDAEQLRLMEERCILLDRDDNPIGDASKKTCHLMENINPPQSLLHRAFSVFLFRPTDGRLLLQQRAAEKITFPSMWTNTCCSHPLALPQEMAPQDQIGVRRAAQRKLEHELGIPFEQAPVDDFVYITRIHYLAPSDGLWGEHEIDYVLFLTANVDLDVNPNEVSDVQWVNKEELEALFQDPNIVLTPWFKLIARSFLYKWWDLLLSRSKALSLLEGTHPDATTVPEGKTVVPANDIAGPADVAHSNAKVDATVLKDLITDLDKNEIIRF